MTPCHYQKWSTFSTGYESWFFDSLVQVQYLYSCHILNPRRIWVYKSTANGCSEPDIKIPMTVSAPLDPSLLVLDSGDEAFFKAMTKIDDTQELRNHIQTVAREAYEVSKSG